MRAAARRLRGAAASTSGMSEAHALALTAVAAALSVDYLQLRDLRRQAPAWWQDVLAVVRFDGGAAPLAPPAMSLTDVNAPVLGGLDATDSPADGSHGTAEVWRLAGPMHSGRRGRVRYRHNG